MSLLYNFPFLSNASILYSCFGEEITERRFSEPYMVLYYAADFFGRSKDNQTFSNLCLSFSIRSNRSIYTTN